MLLCTKLHGKTYEFPDLRLLMGKANEEKSGDRLAGVAAERVAARVALAEIPLWVLRQHPAIPYEQDEVTRVIQEAVHEPAYQEIKDWTVGQLRDTDSMTLTCSPCTPTLQGASTNIGSALPDVVILLIGERPGLGRATSLRAYMTYRPQAGDTDADRDVVSNIFANGDTDPLAGAASVLQMAQKMMQYQASGVKLKLATS
jgi:Ethanolamine ammonia lyase large subunit (EutB)/Ethanolamine ammonia-lyase light chain (EutC)